MKMEFQVTYKGREPVVATAGPKEFVAFERQFQASVLSSIQDMHLEHVYYLSWAALHNAGLEPDGFDDYLSKLDEVEAIPEEKPATAEDPSSPAPSPDTSAS